MTEFEEIYKAYFNDVYRYILRLSGNETKAEDITAEAFFKAMSSISDFRGECDIRVWLCQIAKNIYFSSLKNEKKHLDIDEAAVQSIPIQGDSPDEQIIKNEELNAIQSILHAFEDPYKEVFMWRIYGELSFAEIGRLFGKTENWACVTYHRARKKILKKLEEMGYGK